MAKITLLSPVHVSTGNKIEALSYHVDANIAYRYSFTDLLANIPSQELLNYKLLEDLLKGPKSRNDLARIFDNNIQYDHLDPLYTAECDLVNDFKDDSYDISEQIKDAGKPYIPGSTIKGALIHSWLYYLLKKNYSIIQNKLDKFFSEFDKKKTSLLDLLLNPYSDIKGNELLHEMSSCILCRDIYFQKMEIFEANRIGSNKDCNGNIPLPYQECIQQDQSVNTVFFTIDENRLEKLLEKYKKHEDVLRILNSFKKSIILHACNEFTKDMISQELTEHCQYLYQDYPSINKQIQNVLHLLDLKQSDKLNYILRIGNSTNYYFKSISLLIKKQSPMIYNKYFNHFFSPSTKGKTKSKKETLPKTRVVLTNRKQDYLSGFIMVSYDKKS